MPRPLHRDLLDCLRRPNPYVEYRVELSEPDVQHVVRRVDQFTLAPTLVSMTPAAGLTTDAGGALILTPGTASLANFGGVAASFDLNGEDPQRRVKGVAWKLSDSFTRATLRTVSAVVERVAPYGTSYNPEFELQIFRITKTPGVKQKNVGTPEYSSAAFTEFSFTPLLTPAPVRKGADLVWDGANRATLSFDVSPWALMLENRPTEAASPDQTGELPEYLFVIRLVGKPPKGTGWFRWRVDNATARTVAGVGDFERVFWERDSDEKEWKRQSFADAPNLSIVVETYPATGQAVYALDMTKAPRADSIGRAVFGRAVPSGTTALLEISTAGAAGPFAPIAHGDLITVPQQTYHVRLTLSSDGAGRSTPRVNALGLEYRIPTDVSLESITELPTREIELPYTKASIPEGRLSVLRTGRRDYLDVASRIASTQPSSRLEVDIFLASRHPAITRDKWHRLERMAVSNRTPTGTSEDLTLLSYGARLKRKIPRKTETLNSVHTVQAGSTASQIIVSPVLPGTTAGGNEFDGKNYYIRVRSTSALNTAAGFLAVLQGNTGTDRLDFVPSLPEALVAGDIIELHSGVYQTQALSWTNADPANIWWEILTSHLGEPGERIGSGFLPRGGKPPKVTDIAPGDAATQSKRLVTCRVSEEEGGDELLDQLSFIMGGVTLELDGQIVFVQIYPLRDGAGRVTVPLPSPSFAFDVRDYTNPSTPPGLEKRATIVSAKYGVPLTAASPDSYPSRTTTTVDQDALLWLSEQQDLDDTGPSEVPDKISRWLYNTTDQGLYLAAQITDMVVRTASTGLRVFTLQLVERHPEIIPGDVGVFYTDQYTDYDPALGIQIRGPLAIRGVVTRASSDGRQISLFVPGLVENVQQLKGGFAGALAGLGAVPDPPVLSASFRSNGELVISSAGDGSTATQKIAWSLVATPSDADVRAAAVQTAQVAGLATGLIVPPGGQVFIAAFAYNANGVESLKSSREDNRSGATGSSAFLPRAGIESATGDYDSEALRFTGVLGAGGLDPLEWRYREYSTRTGEVAWPVAWNPNSGPTALPALQGVARDNKWLKRVDLQVRDASGLIGETFYIIEPIARGSEDAGGRVEEDRQRAGSGGVATPRARILAEPLYNSPGDSVMIDTELGRMGTALSGPTGITSTVIERGGNKGDQALDVSNILNPASWDGVRAYTGKHLANVPDDATSDRRASTLNQKTGGDRGYAGFDSGNVAVAAAVDFIRAYLGKHLANVPDDATSDRRAATLNEKTGGTRGYTAIDSGFIILPSGVDFTRTYTNKHIGNVPDDATTDRRASTLNQKTGGDRGYAGLDSGNVVVAAALDLVRAYTGKHLANIPDDATSDRRAATLNQKTGGDRGYAGFDSGTVVVTGSIDFIRAYTGKHMGNLPDDATSDRRAVTINEKTGGGRGYAALDSGNVAIAAAIDFVRAYTGKHLANVPDDATSDRRAVSLNEKTGASRAYPALDAASKLVTGVTSAATAADGVAGIESGKGARKKASDAVGVAAQGHVEEGFARQGDGGLPVRGGRIITETIYNEAGDTPLLDTELKRLYGTTMDSSSSLEEPTGILGQSVLQKVAGTGRPMMKGYQSGFVKDAGVVTFNPVFQGVPNIILRGGKAANATYPYDDFAAVGASASGFTCRAKNKAKGTVVARVAEFTAPLSVTSAGSAVGAATTASAPSTDGNYKARYSLTLGCTVLGADDFGSVTVIVAIESSADSGSTWTERATRSFTFVQETTGTGSATYSAQEVTVNVAGLDSTDQIRLKLKSIATAFGASSPTATLEGYNYSPTSEGHGVEYSTDAGATYEEKTPQADDFIFWEAFEVAT